MYKTAVAEKRTNGRGLQRVECGQRSHDLQLRRLLTYHDPVGEEEHLEGSGEGGGDVAGHHEDGAQHEGGTAPEPLDERRADGT